MDFVVIILPWLPHVAFGIMKQLVMEKETVLTHVLKVAQGIEVQKNALKLCPFTYRNSTIVCVCVYYASLHLTDCFRQ